MRSFLAKATLILLIHNHLRNPVLKFGANREGRPASRISRGVTQAGGPTGHLDIWRERLSLSPPGLLEDVCHSSEAVFAFLVCYEVQETVEALAFALSKGPLRPPRPGGRESERESDFYSWPRLI